MSFYKFAGLLIEMSPIGSTLKKQTEKYKINNIQKADITLNISLEEIIKAQNDYCHLTFDECEYMLLGGNFYTELLKYDGFLLHSSAVCYQNKAYLFSAPCGTGKSTHASIWLKIFENSFCINDDKPAIRLINGVFCACGTPFSGKTDTSANVCVPLQGICAIERSDENHIEKITGKDSLYPILNQTIRPKETNQMIALLDLIDKLSKSVPIYKLHCNMEDNAAMVAYHGMKQ